MPLDHINGLKAALKAMGARISQLKLMGYSPRSTTTPVAPVQKPQNRRDNPAEVFQPRIKSEEKPTMKKEQKSSEKATKDNIDYEYIF